MARQSLIALLIVCAVSACCGVASAQGVARQRVRDIAAVEGVRENALFGYGIVVGLNGTGDRRQTLFTMQTLANMLQRMGVQVPAGAARVNNVAAVLVTATLPPFARPGGRIDVTVSSVGDAKSLEGGLLVLTPLYGADGQVYAAAQGPLTIGGYAAGSTGNSRQSNHPTVGRIPNGGSVEREVAFELPKTQPLVLSLRDPNFTVARDTTAAINREFGCVIATALDGRRIEIDRAKCAAESGAALIARLENVAVSVQPRARVVLNERTGTIVMGGEIVLAPVSVLHGSLIVEVSTNFQVSQPQPLSQGLTVPVPTQSVRTQERPVRRIELRAGASVEELVTGLQVIGATARDVIAVLQAIKSAGALTAELEVI